MEYTGSVAKGDAAPVHNRRKCKVENADKDRTADNVVIADEDLEQVYDRLFGGALAEYNAAQVAKGHPERQISNYLDKVKADKQLQEIHEFVIAVGDKDSHPDKDVTEAVCRVWLDTFKRRYGEQFYVVQAIIHNDEAVPHMHIEVVPVANSTRGLSRQNSLNKALAQAGHKGQRGMLGMFAEMQEMLTEAMAQHGLERVEGDKSKQMGGASMGAYKRIKAAEVRAEELEEKVADLDAKAELAKEGHRRCEAIVEHPLKNAPDVARFASEAREAAAAAEALAGEIERLRGQCEASERREAELGREVRSLRAACGRAGDLLDRALSAAGTVYLRISDAFGESRVGQLVLGLLKGHQYEIGVTSGYVPGGIELRAVDGQLQRLREASRQQRGQRQHDIQRGRSTTQAR